MYSFFVLGIIPGTNIQITFTMWFDMLLVVGLIYLGFRLRQLILNDHRALGIRRHPLHASQLHVRGF